MTEKREKAVVILRHLLRGGRAFKFALAGDLEPRTFVLDSEYELCELRKGPAGEDVLLRVFGIDMGPFVKICEGLSDAEVFAIGCATALADTASGRQEVGQGG